MRFMLQKALVWSLEYICPHRYPFYCRPATLSSKLDERWRTGLWYGPEDPRWKELNSE